MLVEEGLRCPNAGNMSKWGTGKTLREMYRMMFPVYHIAGAQQNDATVTVPSLATAHIGNGHSEPSVVAAQNMWIAHALGSCNGIAADNGLAIVQWTIVETVVADGITNLLLLRGIACEIYKEIMGGC